MNELKTKERGKYLPLIAVTVSAVLLISALIFCVTQLNDRARSAEMRGERMASEAIYEVDEGLTALSHELEKLDISGRFSPYAVRAYERIGIIASTTETSVSYLPLPYEITIKLSDYLNRVADAAHNFPTVRGGSMSELCMLCREFSQAFHSFATTRDTSALRGIYAADAPMMFDNIEMPDLVRTRSFKGLEKLEEVDESQAAAILENALGAERVDIAGFTEEPDAFVFTVNVGGEEGVATVSVKGGVILSYSVATAPSDTLTRSEAIDKAKEFASKLGYEGMDAVWYSAAGGFNYVSLAPIENGIKYYTDLIKIKLSGSGVCALDALGYCECRCERDCTPLPNESVARSALPDGFDVKSSSLALIPIEGKEVLCYEFYGEINDADYFIYVDDGARIQDVSKVMRGSLRGEVRV